MLYKENYTTKPSGLSREGENFYNFITNQNKITLNGNKYSRNELLAYLKTNITQEKRKKDKEFNPANLSMGKKIDDIAKVLFPHNLQSKDLTKFGKRRQIREKIIENFNLFREFLGISFVDEDGNLDVDIDSKNPRFRRINTTYDNKLWQNWVRQTKYNAIIRDVIKSVYGFLYNHQEEKKIILRFVIFLGGEKQIAQNESTTLSQYGEKEIKVSPVGFRVNGIASLSLNS